MIFDNDQFHLSATDLANHLGCRHLTTLDRLAATHQLPSPHRHDPALEVLEQRGREHEQAYVDHLRAQGLTVHQPAAGKTTAFDATVAAMRSGVDVIVQASVQSSPWRGVADILLRVDTPSDLGPYGYEVVDTKLARSTRAGTILQLCVYSDIVGEVQGRLPERMHVVSPGTDFTPVTFQLHDVIAYYRYVRQRLLAAVEPSQPDDAPPTYPEPVAQCDICRWWSRCNKQRREDDHLSFVARLTKLQRRELDSWDVRTLSELAQLPLPLDRRPKRGSVASYVRAREQARVQLQSRGEARPVYELLDREPERGLARLPAPSPGDIFLDLEGDPYVGTGGLEYLFGWVTIDTGEPVYNPRWATGVTEERENFEAFIDMVMERRERYPELHIYHFAPYEPVAIKRLMGRYATRQAEVDRLLRGKLFVDLFGITTQSLRAGIERYSIKELEPLYDFKRDLDLREASDHLRRYERALELGVPKDAADARGPVASYNRDDCVSALHLRDWLEVLRAGLVDGGESVDRPDLCDDQPGEKVSEREQRVNELRPRLLAEIPDEPEARSAEQHATWLLAHMLDHHLREDKVAYWEKFRLEDLEEEDLLADSSGLAELEYVCAVEVPRVRVPVHRYKFPLQETKLSKGPVFSAGGSALGSVHAIDRRARTIDIKKKKVTSEVHPSALFGHSVFNTTVVFEAIMRLGEWVADHGIDADGPYRAARDLLLARPPRLGESPSPGAPLRRADESPLAAARRLALELDHGLLAVQGPPGSGKSYTGGRMICSLVAARKRLGITGMSHKVIRNLVDKVIEAATDEGLELDVIIKVGNGEDTEAEPSIEKTDDNGTVEVALASRDVEIGAGTRWLWARETMHESVDVLVVDEAAQMSLADVIGVGQGARSIVLLGDPQQLDQPLRANHPDGTALSALQHMLGDSSVMPPDRGLFLPETWRMHPDVCEFTSELFYDSQLGSRPGLERQALAAEPPFVGAGLWFVPVDHEGNQASSAEEVDRVAEIYDALRGGTAYWRNADGEEVPLDDAQILVVAPYNAQVVAIEERLPEARVGTVDKFQGQEAAVVIYSMATSTPEEAPRGMEFLFSPNRLNVATSRARCACILVANPRLFEPDCQTPRQMQLANAYCRYLELATRI